MTKPRKVPLRRCTGCMEMMNKKELIRVVHNNENEIFLDPTGKKNGRGAYVCKNADCLEKALKNKGIERSLSCQIPDEVKKMLREQMAECRGAQCAPENGT